MIDSTNPRVMADNIRQLAAGGGGSQVEANPEGAATEVLAKLGVGEDIYSVPLGMFIDPTNVVHVETTIEATGLNYIATEDCFVYLYLFGGNNTEILIGGVSIAGNFSSDKATYLIPVKKGQTITTTAGSASNTYTVLGILTN